MSNRRSRRKSRIPVTALACGLIFVCFLLLIIVVIIINSDNSLGSKNNQTVTEESFDPYLEPMPSDDFDFREIFPSAFPSKETDEEEDMPVSTPAPTSDSSTDGKHTLVVLPDKTKEWVTINKFFEKNTIDTSKLIVQNGFLKYYPDGKLASYSGTNVSKHEDYVDFTKLKKGGASFVMLRVGVRGYSTGKITLDENFSDNLKRATDAGLDVGVYFQSQAITCDEAIEEAEFVIEAVKDAKITYPVAFNMGFAENDTARIEYLTNDQRTEITDAFLNRIKSAGYNAVIYADKEWLIKEIELSQILDYDIWLISDGASYDDFPYRFSMLTFTDHGIVDGISGNAEVNISFVDYTEK